MPGSSTDNPATRLVSHATTHKYAIPSICIYNLEAAHATLVATKSLSSPSMLLLFPWSLTYPALVFAISALAHNSPRNTSPCTLHLDHAQSPEVVKKAADMSPRCFDSIMVDMSHYPEEENLRLTRELTAYCHERGVAVEAEVGRIEGGEDGVKATGEELQGMMTTREAARRFVDCGVDWLAPAFGNVHGRYGERGIRLDYERLRELREEVGRRRRSSGGEDGGKDDDGGVDLVLHGTDGFEEKEYRRCIEAGVSKININGCVNARWREAMREQGTGLTEATDKGIEAMRKEVETLIRWCGSEGMGPRIYAGKS